MEVEGAIQKGGATCALGLDGLTYKLYTAYRTTLTLWLAQVYNESQKGQLPPSQLEVKMTFFAKERDRAQPETWRPITLLNTYKILSNFL